MAVVRPAIRFAPQPEQDRELVLHEVRAVLDRREGETELAMFEFVPAGAHADLDPSTAHLVHGRHDLGERARVAKRDGRDEHAEADPVRLTRETGHDGPCIRGGLAGRSREALVVIRTEERLETVRLSTPGDRDVVAVAESLLRFEHEGEAHPVLFHSFEYDSSHDTKHDAHGDEGGDRRRLPGVDR